MDSTKLEKKYNKELPRWIRVRNFIAGIFDIFEAIEGLAGILLLLLLGILVSPFVLLFEATGWVFRKK
jgi:hypothetical protein